MFAQPSFSRDRLYPLLGAFGAGVAVFACLPFADAGFNDDWGYAHIALNLARTGHFSYGSLSISTLLFQAYWGSLLVHLFGFSFLLLRFSTLPFAMGCGVLTYRLARKAGLCELSSLFASLCLVTSPLFTPLAASFMTDVYGCFFTLLSIYLGACAGGAALRTGATTILLVGSTAAGLVGGLNRQTVYIAPGSVLLWAIWRYRKERAVAVAAMGLLATLSAGAFFAVRWQSQQSHSDGLMIYEPLRWMKSVLFPTQMILTLTLLALPVLVLFGRGGLSVTKRLYAISLLVVLSGMAAYRQVSHQFLFPWMVNMMTKEGILSSWEEMRGMRPVVLSRGVQIALTMVVLTVLVRVGAVSMSAILSPARKQIWRNWPAALQIFAVFGASYAGFLFIQARVITFDRYLLPLVPLTLIVSLVMHQKMGGRSLGYANWGTLAVFALYAIATSHDYFAALNARVTAFRRLEDSGVERRQISGGLEMDGWTQAEAAGHLYLPDIKTATAMPPSAYWFLRYTPDVVPRYFLSWSDERGMKNADVPGVTFRAWLPPFRREVKILVPVIKE
jgi:hypothetical protein